MKRIIIVFVLIFSITVYGQGSINTNNQVIKIKENTAQFQHDESTIYQLKKDIIDVKEDNLNLKKEIEEKHNDWLSYIANFWTIIGLALGSITIFFSLKDRIKKEVTTQVAKKVEKEVALLEEQLSEIEKHKKYKTNSKILIINKSGTNFPHNFKTVLKLFNTDINDKNNLIEADTIATIVNDSASINKLKEADLVIIENKESCSINGWCINKNKGDFSDLANKICNDTPIMYYGNNHFPITKIDPNKQHYVAFTKAASQLYGNILNLLKYKFELDNTPTTP